MITMQQAMTGQEFHEDHEPAGKIYTWRRNGATQTWKTRPGEFRIPVKYGLRSYDQIHHYDAHRFHLASECPSRSFTVTCISVRCAVNPETGKVYEDPANHGKPFGSITEAQQYVREALNGLSSTWRVYLYDAEGTRAMRGTRSDVEGGTANGKRWIWEATPSALARVTERGSNPDAIAEAEGDFGPGGLFT